MARYAGLTPLHFGNDHMENTTVTYLSESEIKSARMTDAPASGRTASGYGSKVPTSYELQLSDKRWRRVYLAIYSNQGSLYVRVGGQSHYLGEINPRDHIKHESECLFAPIVKAFTVGGAK